MILFIYAHKINQEKIINPYFVFYNLKINF